MTIGTHRPRPAQPPSDSASELESRLVKLVTSSSVLMRALRAARTLNLPDWLIGAGVLRDRVWDHLHASSPHAPSRDVDLAFFDPTRIGRLHEVRIQMAITKHAPNISWDVTNQAGVHLWYPHVFGTAVDPLSSSADAVATWPETATAVAVRLLPDNRIQVVAPYGLNDLFNLVCRHNPRRATAEQYRHRIDRLQIARRWPQVQILDAQD